MLSRFSQIVLPGSYILLGKLALAKLFSRGAESRTWARGQLKYDGFPVLWTPKQTGKMLQFCPNYDVISKKKDLHRNSNGFFGRNKMISK